MGKELEFFRTKPVPTAGAEVKVTGVKLVLKICTKMRSLAFCWQLNTVGFPKTAELNAGFPTMAVTGMFTVAGLDASELS